MYTFEKYKKFISGALIASVVLLGTACNASSDEEKKVEAPAKTATKTEVAKTKTATAEKTTNSDIYTTKDTVFPSTGKKGIDGGAVYTTVDGMYTIYAVNEQEKKNFTFGRTPTKNEEAAWDIDVMPDGTGLPEGQGSVEEGDELYEEKCAMCHGDFGSGGIGSRSAYPTLSVGEASTDSLTNQRITPDADGPKRVIGTYWPYASTLFWYIQSGMPFPHPKSLSNDETYALVAYLLSVNEVEIDGETLDDEYVLNREKFLKIKMPNQDGFIPNIDGPTGPKNVREFYADPSNYGNGTRCMKDCLNGEKPNIVRPMNLIDDFEPPMSVERSMPKEDSLASTPSHPGKKLYESSCAVCHATDAMGAPSLGDKAAWNKVLKKGIEAVYTNGIKGINAMPPKGGTTVSDEEFKAAVDYMIDKSK